MKTIVFIHGVAGSKNNFEKLEKILSKDFKTICFDLIGYGTEIKPKINYDLKDFINFIESKIDFKENNYILVGHSMGGIIAKGLAIKYHKKVKKVFLISYPLADKENLIRTKFDKMYVEGHIIAKITCHTKHIWKYLIYPWYILTSNRHIKSYWDVFNHTYYSSSSSIKNTILKDNKNDLKKIKNKVIIIKGNKDRFLDQNLSNKYKHYTLNMGHQFFGNEEEIAKIIKKETK